MQVLVTALAPGLKRLAERAATCFLHLTPTSARAPEPEDEHEQGCAHRLRPRLHDLLCPGAAEAGEALHRYRGDGRCVLPARWRARQRAQQEPPCRGGD